MSDEKNAATVTRPPLEAPAGAPNVLAPVNTLRMAARALYLVVFVSGAILMGIEIAGSRILAPSFGTSIFVWGSLIGLFMGAMAAGYYVGGKWADKNPSFVVLSSVVGIAGLYTFFVLPYGGSAICEAVARAVTHRMAGPLLASAVLFFLPIFLMAMVSPFAIKLQTTSLSGVGGVAGWLYALSTFGSIVGTLGTTFFLIPYCRVPNVIMGLSAALLITAVLSLVVFKGALGGLHKQDRFGAALLALIALALLEIWALYPVSPSVPGGERMLAYHESEYHDIGISEDVMDIDNGELYQPRFVRRLLKFNENWESGTYPYSNAYLNSVGYTDLLHLPVVWVHAPEKLLVVGGGGAIIPSQYTLHYPSIKQVDILELDSRVREVAQTYFQVPKDPRIRFHIGDARLNLRDIEDKYDVIVLDAYSSGGQIPFHLLTWEFLKSVRDHLKPGGVLATNIISAMQNPPGDNERPADLLLAEYVTLKASEAEVHRLAAPTPEQRQPLFKQVYIFPRVSKRDSLKGHENDHRNIIVVATLEDNRMSQAEIVSIAKSLTLGKDPAVKIDGETFVWHAEHMYDREPRPDETQHLLPLCDEFAPVDTMYRPIKQEETMRRLY
ncbi:MAG: fused MFS/spermidine synthase [Planctomycetes bacterium]|nr:fused MFS/spermidine synthase [Planctomycetota bacterium]